ncbi:MAG: helix-turn-helix transcriptional regulator [Nocardioidaceae bacterium]
MRDWITTEEAAAMVGIKADTLRHYVRSGHAPEPERFGRALMWNREVIERWQASRPGRGVRTDLAKKD